MSSYINHSHITKFAEEKVNLPSDYAKKYRNQVNNLRDGLKKHINENPEYNLVKMYHSGSVAKGTALKTLNDMDVAVYVKKTDESLVGDELLTWLKERLQEVYPTFEPSRFVIPPGGHCVTLSFKGTGLDVDVSPIIYEGDPDDKGYLTTKDSGEQVLTSIPMHLEFIRKRKKECPNHYQQIIRILKWWVREQKKSDTTLKFKSFMVEMIAAHLLDSGIPMDNYISALEQFYLYIVKTGLKKRIYFTDYYNASALPSSTKVPIEIFDPVNPDNNVCDSYSEQNRFNIVERAHDALDAIHEAAYATTQGRATECWKRILGSSFNI